MLRLPLQVHRVTAQALLPFGDRRPFDGQQLTRDRRLERTQRRAIPAGAMLQAPRGGRATACGCEGLLVGVGQVVGRPTARSRWWPVGEPPPEGPLANAERVSRGADVRS